MKRLIGIYREKEYSPGRHQSNDVILIEAIAARLRAGGLAVDLITADEVNEPRTDAELVFSMCQGRAALDQLAEWERSGVVIINSPAAARNTHRDRLSGVLQRARIPFPHTELVETARKLNGTIRADASLWLKRGDVHASVAADVQRLNSISELAEAIQEFHQRGIVAAAVQTHCAGDEIKFYGIGDGEFFHWFYSREAKGYAFDTTALVSLAASAARAAGLDIFGGDIIVGPNGDLTLIDLNDWPSFAPCRDAAADAIASFVRRRVHAD